jgi:eukaryotic-like serine/threonine-protein kinase
VTARPAGDDPAHAAEALTRARAQALARMDDAALSSVDAAGSPALAADRELLASVGAARLDGLAVTVHAEADAGGTDGTDGTASVLVTSSTSPYVRVAADGSRASVAASPERTVRLELHRTDGGWRVWSVEAP